ncbi:hypothetical protein [Oceanithermus sp.]
MERRNGERSEWQLALTVKKQDADKLVIEVNEGRGKKLVFDSWASLYHYLSQRFPEHRGFLR